MLVLTTAMTVKTPPAANAAASVHGVYLPPAQVSPSPTPQGQIRLPTATNTVIGGPTATPSRTPTPTPVLAEAIGEANLRSGPALNFEIVGQIVAGNPVPVLGRSVQQPWYLVAWEEAPGGQAWVFEQLVIIIGDITTVPIVDVPEAPTIDPGVGATETAGILLQTPGAAETATATAFFVPTGIFTTTPGVEAELPSGVLPTFTAPPPINQPDFLAPRGGSRADDGGIPAAVVIFSLGAMGVLTLLVGLLRRLF